MNSVFYFIIRVMFIGLKKQDYINKEFKLKTWNDKRNYSLKCLGLVTGGL